MYSQHALIVDDSKTAQFRLKRMLEAYEVEIDIVSSAEEALAYLSYRVPAVVFLDQSMQGMDGIEALRTIKANPNTATIPVIMYTSEKGKVFTGQARALGALDILYKSTLKPSNLEKVLSTLKIPARKTKKTRETAPEAEAEGGAPTPPPPPRPAVDSPNISARRAGEPLTRSDLDEIRSQIARLFEIHIADVGRQIAKSTQFLTRRLSSNQDNTAQKPPEVVVGDVPLSVINDEVAAERRRIAVVSNSLLAVLLVGLVIMGGLLFNLFGRLSSLSESFDQASAVAEMNATQISQLSEQVYSPSNTASVSPSISNQSLGLLTWATNTGFGFDIDEEPLNERTVAKLQQLIYQLAETGYRGVVELNMNFGNTCLTHTESGTLVTAPADMPVTDCVFRESLNQDYETQDYLSLPYTAFEQSSPILNEGRINLAISSSGLDNPRVDYPEVSDSITAADWNRVAAKNNYLAFMFHPME